MTTAALVPVLIAAAVFAAPGRAAAVVRVRLVNTGAVNIAGTTDIRGITDIAGTTDIAGALLLGSRAGGDVVIDMATVLARSHARTGAVPERTPEFRRQVVRAKRNFGHLLAGMVRCANVYFDAGFHACDGAPAIDLYNMLAATWSSDPQQPAGLRMNVLFEGPIRARGDALHLAVNNPLLARLGFAWVSCSPVITDATNATCLLAMSPALRP